MTKPWVIDAYCAIITVKRSILQVPCSRRRVWSEQRARSVHVAKFDDVMRDKAQVRDRLYGDPAKLGAREDLQRCFSVNPLPIADWELGLADLSNVRQALDAGCGNGAFLLPL